MTTGPVTPKKLNTLHKAVYTNDVERVRKLMAQKDRVSTGLETATACSRIHKLTLVICDIIQDPNKVDSFHGCTALHIAAEFNKLDVVKLLLDPEKMGPAGTWATPIDRRADPSLKNLEGKTPFLMVNERSSIVWN